MSENLWEIVWKMLSVEDISPEIQEQLMEVKKWNWEMS